MLKSSKELQPHREKTSHHKKKQSYFDYEINEKSTLEKEGTDGRLKLKWYSFATTLGVLVVVTRLLNIR